VIRPGQRDLRLPDRVGWGPVLENRRDCATWTMVSAIVALLTRISQQVTHR
jgi:hypothetical protein